jgi:Domain of unknown function (DUF4439)
MTASAGKAPATAASPTPRAGVGPLQAALAAEHAALYAYGVVGAILGRDEERAVMSYDEHRAQRDELVARIGPAAVAAEPAYALPFPVTDDRQAQRLARVVEHRCAAVYADVVSRTSGAARMLAARGLTDCALRGLRWDDAPEPFPGLGSLRS